MRLDEGENLTSALEATSLEAVGSAPYSCVDKYSIKDIKSRPKALNTVKHADKPTPTVEEAILTFKECKWGEPMSIVP
jgi:hypothetical protein